jgi:hypothetical protein
VFEFVVVLAGVLAAQALANYVQHRADLARMEDDRARVRYELETAYSINEAWNRAIPCLNQRMTEVMAGRPLTAAELRRPSMPTRNYSPSDTETLNLIERRYGVEEKNRLKAATDAIQSLIVRNDLIVSAWGRLLVLDPANGPISAADRVQARLAAAEIKGNLRSMEITTDAASGIFQALGLQARNHDESDKGPARSCAAIWKTGQIEPPLTTP